MLVHSPAQLANVCKERRKAKDQGQAEVADRIAVKQATVSGFENRPDYVRLKTLFKILAALDLELHVVPREDRSSADTVIPNEWKEEW